MACMCGCVDCPSCGPAQGYEVIYDAWNHCYVAVEPDPEDEEDEKEEDE